MGDTFDFNSILGEGGIGELFRDIKPDPEESASPEEKDTGESSPVDEMDINTEVGIDEIFGDDPSESVGEKKNTGQEGSAVREKSDGSSPNEVPLNFYSSIAKALKEDGIFPDLEDDDIASAATPEDFSSLVEKQVVSRLDQTQKRINDALEAEVPVAVIRQYEQTLSQLEQIDSAALEKEGEEADALRQQLLYNDFLTKGFDEKRARKEVEKSFKAGTDVEDAKDALDSLKALYSSQYKAEIAKAQKEKADEDKAEKESLERVRNGILEEEFLGGLEVSKAVRQKALDAALKGTIKDDDGSVYTALQDYERKNKEEFIKNVGLLFVLTDGFKSLDNIVKGKVKKEMKKGLRSLEHVLNTSQRSSTGGLSLMGDYSGGDDSYSGKGQWRLGK